MSPSQRWSSLTVLAGGNFAQFGTRLLLGTLAPLLLVEFETTKSSIGLILTGLWAVYALFQFPSGILADRYGERPLLVVGLCGAVLGATLVAASPDLLLFGGATLLLGAGTGLYFSPASSLASRAFEEHGRALSVVTASGAVAGIIYPAAGSLIGVALGWRYAMVLSTLVTVPLIGATLTVIPSLPAVNPSRSLRAAVDLNSYSHYFARPNVVYTVVVASLVGFFFQGITSFLPTFFVEYRAVDPGFAGALFGAVLGLSAITQPIAGVVSDHTSRDFAIAVSLVIALGGIGLLLEAPGPAGLYGGVALLGAGISWPGPIQARIVDQFAESERGYGFGLLRTVYMLLASTSSVIIGTLVDISGWAAGFGVIVILSLACLSLLAINHALSLGL